MIRLVAATLSMIDAMVVASENKTNTIYNIIIKLTASTFVITSICDAYLWNV